MANTGLPTLDAGSAAVLFIKIVIFVELSRLAIHYFYVRPDGVDKGEGAGTQSRFGIVGADAIGILRENVGLIVSNRPFHFRVAVAALAVALLWAIGLPPSGVLAFWADFVFGYLANSIFFGDPAQITLSRISALLRLVFMGIAMATAFVFVFYYPVAFIVTATRAEVPVLPVQLRVCLSRYVVFPMGVLMLAALVIDYALRPIIFLLSRGFV